MSLPEICPLDITCSCKGSKCHLYHVEWRTKEPECLVGYGSISRTKSKKVNSEDTYAEETFKRLGKPPQLQKRDLMEASLKTRGEAQTGAPKNPGKRPAGNTIPAGKSAECHLENPAEGSGKESLGLEKIRTLLKYDSQPGKETPANKASMPRERIISQDKHATLIEAFENPSSPSSRKLGGLDRQKEPERNPETREKRKKLEKMMSLELPENYEEDFWK